MPAVTPNTMPVMAIAAVAGSASAMMSLTERPGLSRRLAQVAPEQVPYIDEELLRERLVEVQLFGQRRSASSGEYSVPRMTFTGSPGVIRTSRNTRITTTEMVRSA